MTTTVPSDLLQQPFRKNAIINGNFDIWQRGTSHSTTGYGSADRWKVWYTGTGTTLTVSQQDFALGQTSVPNEPKSFCQNTFVEGTGTTSLVQFYQLIESVRTFAGQTVTLSFWAKASASLNLGLVLQQVYGTGGSPSTNNSVQELISLTTGWAKYAVTFDVPSISGKTLGTNNDDSLSVVFWFSGGSAHTGAGNPGLQTGTIDIAQVQVEKGTIATDFERRHIADELALCQRYYEKSYAVDVDPATVTNLGAVTKSPDSTVSWMHFGKTSFKVKKRSVPTVTAYNPNDGTTGEARNSNAATDVPVTITITGSDGFGTYVNNTSVTQSNICNFHWTADAEL